MVRNLILLLASGGILAVIFFAYTLVVSDPTRVTLETAGRGEAMPGRPAGADDTTLELAAGQGSDDAATVPLPASDAGVNFTRYDPATGQAVQQFDFQSWQKVPGTKNDVLVTDAQMTVLLNDGRRLVVAADEGQISAHAVSEETFEPRRGRLSGNVRVMVYERQGARESGTADAPPARPDSSAVMEDDESPLVTVELENLHFDTSSGRITSPGVVRAYSDRFALESAGLELIWNETADRLEAFSFSGAGQLTLRDREGLFRLQSEEPAEAAPDGASDQPAGARPSDRLLSYEITLAQRVVATQRREDQDVAGLNADWLRLVFDFGGPRVSETVDPTLEPDAETDTDAPAQPTREPPVATEASAELPQALVVNWSGSLAAKPVGTPDDPGVARRHLTAGGDVVELWQGTRRVRCGELRLQEESDQIWLSPTAAGFVEITPREGTTARAVNAYVDLAGNVIKLIGDVQFSEDDAAAPMTMRARDWAELWLRGDEPAAENEAAASAPPRDDATADAFGFDQALERVVLVGDVAFSSGRQQLTAARMELFFAGGSERPEAAGNLESLLARAIASTNVTLADRPAALGSRIERVGRDAFAIALGAAPPAPLGVTQYLSCDALDVAFAPDAAGRAQPNVMRADGSVFLVDRGSDVELSAAGLDARFTSDRALQRATLHSRGRQWAQIAVEPFHIAGQTIVVNAAEELLTVPGESRLLMRSERGLQGQDLAEPQLVRIRSRDEMRIDGRSDRVTFRGRVVAQRGDEELRSDELELRLARTAPPPSPPAEPPAAADAPDFSALFGGEREDGARTLWSGAQAIGGDREPRTLIARNAVVATETYTAGDPVPRVHASLAAPRLAVDLPNQIIRTTGETTLLLTDRRLPERTDARESRSALLSRGPAQTALQSLGGMTYAIGRDGDERRDFAVFEGGVQFVHRAGEAMANLEKMLPAGVDPARRADLRTRNSSLSSERLEVEFRVEGDRRAQLGLGGALGLSSLMAVGQVALRDRQGDGLLEVRATQLEYDADARLLRVSGSDRHGAFATYTNPRTGDFINQQIGSYFEYDLMNEVFRSQMMTGEIIRN